MKKWIFILMILYSSTLFAQNWLTNMEQAKKIAQQEDKDILVNFTGSDWCGWCVRLSREVFETSEWAKFSKNNLVLLKIDFPRRKTISAEQMKHNSDLADQFQIQGFPTICLLTPEGKIYEKTGYKPGGAKVYIQHIQELQKKRPARKKIAPKEEKKDTKNKIDKDDTKNKTDKDDTKNKTKKKSKEKKTIKNLLSSKTYTIETWYSSLEKALGISIIPDKIIPAKWYTNFEEACSIAKLQNKDVLVNFSGSDWCIWCIRLWCDVFNTKEWNTVASKGFVFVEIDFPSKIPQDSKTKAYNQNLAKKFKVQAYPSVLLFHSSGELYAKTGYKEGNAESYIYHLTKLSEQEYSIAHTKLIYD
ncbi:MAG TPA: thioredoxin family protein [Planctomycetota bacterium]|nr:thioredoxin family protein [Planctomycetota bacterium]HPY74191.1 thioredoxin family protein [Planctomycetota bacterium]HQA99805.1 thioredoxin family protein [Planctomycetota bacterium]